MKLASRWYQYNKGTTLQNILQYSQHSSLLIPEPVIIVTKPKKFAKYEEPMSWLIVGIVIIVNVFQALVCVLINLAFPFLHEKSFFNVEYFFPSFYNVESLFEVWIATFTLDQFIFKKSWHWAGLMPCHLLIHGLFAKKAMQMLFSFSGGLISKSSKQNKKCTPHYPIALLKK